MTNSTKIHTAFGMNMFLVNCLSATNRDQHCGRHGQHCAI